jgi:hypothetical protein
MRTTSPAAVIGRMVSLVEEPPLSGDPHTNQKEWLE